MKKREKMKKLCSYMLEAVQSKNASILFIFFVFVL